VVGRERPEHRVGPVPLREDRRGQADGGHRVARGRLRDDLVRTELGELRGDRRRVPHARHDEHALGPGEREQPVDGPLQQGAAGAGEVVQELRGALAGQRPQPGAGAAGGDDGVEAGDRGRRGGGGRHAGQSIGADAAPRVPAVPDRPRP
jgi:hypothetical protein